MSRETNMHESAGKTAAPIRYEAVIKVNRDDEPTKRARDIVDGIHYAAALLKDEYGWSDQEVYDLMEGVAMEHV